MRARWVKLWVRLVAAAAASGLACAAGLVAAPAAGAAVTAKAPHVRLHVSPFGAGAHRVARHASTRRARAPLVATPVTRWVSNTIPSGSPPGTSCNNPGYSTISAALAAASPGDTINVCAGTYPEQLAITRSITLTAKGAVTVVGPASPSSSLTPCDADGGGQPNQDVVDICGSGTPGSISVAISGLTIKGSWPALVCYDSIYGVAVLGGANLVMSKSTVENIGGDPQQDGCQGGVGIQVGLALTGTTADTGTATLTNDVVESYQKNGITVDGHNSGGASFATITGATVTGTGPTPAIAQNGIQVSDGAGAKISTSAVTGDECNDTNAGPPCGPNGYNDTQSAGILLFDAGKTTVSRTTVSASDIGVYSIQDYAWQFYTPPSPFTPVLETFSGMGLNNRYENAYFDEGNASLSSSTLSGGVAGIEVGQASYQTIKPVVTAKTDTITGTATISGNPTAAILVATDKVPGDLPVKLGATGDSFGTSNSGGVLNQTTSVLSATHDWWGGGTGPSDWNFGSGSSVSADVNFFPWATDSTLTTFETCTIGTSVTTNGDQVVLCAKAGTATSFLANNGTGRVLLIGNKGNDQLNGSSGGETWIIGGVGGTNVINGNNGTGFIQERGNSSDTVINASGYMIAAS